jgi:hypothetical protein
VLSGGVWVWHGHYREKSGGPHPPCDVEEWVGEAGLFEVEQSGDGVVVGEHIVRGEVAVGEYGGWVGE